MSRNIIISLFDYSGGWSKPYREAGYEVIQIDIKHGTNILTWDYTKIDSGGVHGILCAVPCTDYSLSGARWWEGKDRAGSTERSNELVRKSLEIIRYFAPDWWVLENPIGRIDKCVPELKQYFRMSFNPCDYGDPYTKKTKLWGEFNPWLITQPVHPHEGSKMYLLYGGKSERTKELRSITPKGFAQAFFEANNNLKVSA